MNTSDVAFILLIHFDLRCRPSNGVHSLSNYDNVDAEVAIKKKPYRQWNIDTKLANLFCRSKPTFKIWRKKSPEKKKKYESLFDVAADSVCCCTCQKEKITIREAQGIRHIFAVSRAAVETSICIVSDNSGQFIIFAEITK